MTFLLLSCPTHSVLFDASGSRGQSPENWPDIIPGKYCGYAGGLGPGSVVAQFASIGQAAQDSRFWIDMEGKIRNASDELDLDLCQAVLEAVYNS